MQSRYRSPRILVGEDHHGLRSYGDWPGDSVASRQWTTIRTIPYSCIPLGGLLGLRHSASSMPNPIRRER